MAGARTTGRTLRWAVVAVLLMLIALPAVAFSALAQPTGGGPGLTQPAQGVPEVTWNGVNVDTATSPSSALTITYNAAANVLYSWGATNPAGVATARLAMIYFGFALSTRDVAPVQTPLGPGTSAVMNWTVGPIQYLVEGIYGVTASLIAGNGSTLWSENFYLKLTAPGSILAAVPIIVILIIVYELYNAARSGRYIRLDTKSPPKSDSGGASAPPAESAGSSSPPPSDSPPPAEGGPPGGTS